MSGDPCARALRELLESLFSEESLRRWIREHFGAALFHELPGQPASLAQTAFGVIELLQQHGLVDGALFDRLEDQFAGRVDDIRAVRNQCLGERARPRRSAAGASAVTLAGTNVLTVHLDRTRDGRIEVRYQLGAAHYGTGRLTALGPHATAFSKAADHGNERVIGRALSHALDELGVELFQLLLGDEHTWEPLLRALHGVTDPAVPAPTPAARPVHVRICTADPVLASMPWRLTAQSHRLLVLEGWRFVVSRHPQPEETPLLQVPAPVLVVAPRTHGAAAQDVHAPEHSEAVRELLARVWPSSRDARHVNVARTRRELEAMLAGIRPAIVYVYAALEQRDNEPCLLLDPDQGPNAADPLRVAELPRMFQDSGCRPLALYCNTGGFLPSATLHALDVPLLVWRRLPGRASDATHLALRWLQRWLEDGVDPVDALHQLSGELGLTISAEAATLAVRADYRQLRTQLDEHLRLTGEPLMYLDRKEAKDAVVGYLETLASSPARRVTAIVAYASPGNDIAKLAEQLKDELRRRQTSRFAVKPLRLELPLSFLHQSTAEVQHGRLRTDLEGDLRRQLEAAPDEHLGSLLQRHAPRAIKSGRPILWLDWGTFGHVTERPLLKGQHLDAWLHFAAETLASACPPGLRVISYLALETERPEKVKTKLTELHRVLIGYDRFELDQLQLGAVNETHLIKYLRDHTQCPVAMQVEIAQRILADTSGAFDRTVSWLDCGGQAGWRDLMDELRRRQGAAVLDPDDDDLG